MTKQTPEDVFKEVGAIFDRLLAREGSVTLLSLAIELIAVDSRSFVLFAKVGESPGGTARAFVVTGEDTREPKLVETVKKWVVDP